MTLLIIYRLILLSLGWIRWFATLFSPGPSQSLSCVEALMHCSGPGIGMGCPRGPKPPRWRRVRGWRADLGRAPLSRPSALGVSAHSHGTVPGSLLRTANSQFFSISFVRLWRRHRRWPQVLPVYTLGLSQAQYRILSS